MSTWLYTSVVLYSTCRPLFLCDLERKEFMKVEIQPQGCNLRGNSFVVLILIFLHDKTFALSYNI